MARKKRSIQTIKDKALEPYFITKDEYSFTVKELVQSDSNHFRSNGKGKTYEKNLFYFPNFSQALNKIAKLKMDLTDYNSLKDYIKDYESISNQIKNYTDGIRSTI
tara:strand:- start:2639 stop:2956 length:318 start_codon:yes stop_codon:yes gene_type:complete